MAGSPDTRRRVLFVAWFVRPDRLWLGEALDPQQYYCGYVGLRERMDITTKRTTPRKWLAYFKLALKARWHLLFHRYDLVVTSFPQVGFALSVLQRITGERTPHVVWLFNLGHAYEGMMRRLSAWAFRRVSRFIVYTRHERRAYAQLFGLPEERFVFTWLTGDRMDREQFADVPAKYGLPERYIASLGSSSRDYATLFRAVEALPIEVVVVTHRYALEGLTPPANVRVIESIPQHDYLGIIAGALITVVPVSNKETASGQYTYIQAAALRSPVVATRCIGTEDYIVDGENGLFVDMGDVDGLRDRIRTLLQDEPMRQRIIDNAHAFAVEHLFDDAGSRLLDRIYTEMAQSGELRARPAR